MRGGNFPLAYVYPKEMRATRDLLRRRMKIVRHGADLKGHITNTTSQYNLPPHRVTLKNSDARQLIQTHFCTSDPVVKRTVDLDMALIDFYQLELNKIERFIEQQALKHNPVHLTLLKTVNGIGRILALRLSMKLAISIVLHRFKSLHLTHV